MIKPETFLLTLPCSLYTMSFMFKKAKRLFRRRRKIVINANYNSIMAPKGIDTFVELEVDRDGVKVADQYVYQYDD